MCSKRKLFYLVLFTVTCITPTLILFKTSLFQDHFCFPVVSKHNFYTLSKCSWCTLKWWSNSTIIFSCSTLHWALVLFQWKLIEHWPLLNIIRFVYFRTIVQKWLESSCRFSCIGCYSIVNCCQRCSTSELFSFWFATYITIVLRRWIFQQAVVVYLCVLVVWKKVWNFLSRIILPCKYKLRSKVKFTFWTLYSTYGKKWKTIHILSCFEKKYSLEFCYDLLLESLLEMLFFRQKGLQAYLIPIIFVMAKFLELTFRLSFSYYIYKYCSQPHSLSLLLSTLGCLFTIFNRLSLRLCIRE